MSVFVSLHCLIYRSQATGALQEENLAALLQKARVHNQEARLSGLLLYCQGQFLQVLEGTEPALSSLYARIQNDSRHHDVRTLAYGPIKMRSFPDWRMGYVPADEAFLEELTGFVPLAEAPGLTPHPPEELGQLLRDFAQGQVQDC